MRRAEATRRLEGVLRILAEAAGEPLSRVSELYVFGSYARGLLVVGDIDVAIEYDVDEERALKETQLLMSGRSGHGDLSRALFGGQRIFHTHFRERAQLEDKLGGFALLWQRGDRLDDSLARLHGIPADPSASRAARDLLAAPLAGMEEVLGRGLGKTLSEAVDAGTLIAERMELRDGEPDDVEARESIEDRWGPTNPLRRAALAAAAHLERQGVQSIRAWGGPAALSADGGRVVVGLGLKDLEEVPLYLERRVQLWLQVLNPTRRQPLQALLLTPAGDTKRR